MSRLAILCIPLLCMLAIRFAAPPGTRDNAGTCKLVYPSAPRLLTKEGYSHLVLEIDPAAVSSVTFYTPWDSTFFFPLPSKTKRRAVVEQYRDALPNNLLLESIRVIVHPWHMRSDTAADRFPFSARIPGRDFFTSDTSHRSMRLFQDPRDGMTAQIQISGWVPVTVPAGARERFCTGPYIGMPLRLHPGINLVPYEAAGGSGSAPIRDSISIFYALELDEGGAPADFAAQKFHQGEADRACARCHADQSAPDKTAWKCAGCHGAMLSARSVHAPAAGGDCTGCHSDKPGFDATYTADNESETCYTCHEAMGSDVKSGSAHPALLDGRCGKCHSPHASPFVSQLRARADDLCYRCHEEKSAENHPVVFHPVADRMDPRGENREFSCVSCHDPHSSPNPKLSRFGGGYFAGCMSCHKK